jgi:hypothetical protein
MTIFNSQRRLVFGVFPSRDVFDNGAVLLDYGLPVRGTRVEEAQLGEGYYGELGEEQVRF